MRPLEDPGLRGHAWKQAKKTAKMHLSAGGFLTDTPPEQPIPEQWGGASIAPHPPGAYWPDCLSRNADWSLVPDRVQAGCSPLTSPQRKRTGRRCGASGPQAGLGSAAGQQGD